MYVSFHASITSRFHHFAQFLSALKAKEQCPEKVSFLELLELQGRLSENSVTPLWLLEELRFGAQVARSHGQGIFAIKYEDLVDRRLGRLEEYLGFPIAPVQEVAPEYRRVARTKAYGDWRNWFTPKDVDFFRPRLAEAMSPLYEDDWDLPSQPRIPPENASGYLDRLARERGQFGQIDYAPEDFPPALNPLGDVAGRRSAILIPNLRPKNSECYPCRGAEIHDPHVETPEGKRVNVLIQGERYVYTYEVTFTQDAPNLSCWMTLVNRHDDVMLRTGTALHQIDLQAASRAGRIRMDFDFVCNLGPDTYFGNAGVTTWGNDGDYSYLHRLVRAALIVVAEAAPIPPRVTVRPRDGQ